MPEPAAPAALPVRPAAAEQALRRLEWTVLRRLDGLLQGDYRTAHSRLITYAEEIAFFEGSQREQNIITSLFDRLFKHTAYVHTLHGLIGSAIYSAPCARILKR